MKKTISFVTIVFILAFHSPGFTQIREQEPNQQVSQLLQDVKSLPGGSYFETVLDYIHNAKESIFVVMPTVQFIPREKNSRVTKLMKALVRAQRHGVLVFVLMNLDHHGSYIDHFGFSGNRNAFFFLNDNGVDVHFENLAGELTSKFLIFDKKTVVEGSTEWTDVALESKHQTDLIVTSEEHVNELIMFINQIEYLDNPLDVEYYNQLYIDGSLMENPNGFPAFYERLDPDDLKAYLHLLRHYSQQNQPEFVEIDLMAFATELGITKKSRRKGYVKRKVADLLERLRRFYQVIHFEPIRDKDSYKVFFFDLDFGDKLILPFGRGMRLSDSFFEADWLDQLSIHAKYIYLFLLYQEAKEGYGTWFRVSHQAGDSPIKINHSKYVSALRELRRKNLIATSYVDSPKTKDPIYLDYDCLILTPYFKDWFDKKIEAFVDKYTATRVRRALRVAKEFLKEKDPEFIEEIIQLLAKYPEHVIQEVLIKKIYPMEPENPYKTIKDFEVFLDATLKYGVR